MELMDHFLHYTRLSTYESIRRGEILVRRNILLEQSRAVKMKSNRNPLTKRFLIGLWIHVSRT